MKTYRAAEIEMALLERLIEKIKQEEEIWMTHLQACSNQYTRSSSEGRIGEARHIQYLLHIEVEYILSEYMRLEPKKRWRGKAWWEKQRAAIDRLLRPLAEKMDVRRG